MLAPALLVRARLQATILGVLALTMLVALLPATPAHAAEVERLQGDNRAATSVAVARVGWDAAPHVLLATSRDYPDAVAAASLASSLDAPILLTNPWTLSPSVAAALDDLGTERVTVLGGPSAVSSDVVASVRDLGIEVERLAGENRYATASDIATRVYADTQVETVALALGNHATGRDAWPDALSAASLAGGADPVPTLLTLGDRLPDVTHDALVDLAPQRVVVLGGTAAVSAAVVEAVADLGITVERVRGEDRYATAIAVADTAMSGDLGEPLDGSLGVFASGEDFADALGAGALAAHSSAPLLLVPDDVLDDGVDAYLRSAETAFERVLLVGGTAAVSDHVLSELDAAISGEPRPAPPPPPAPPAPTCPANSSPDCQYTYAHPISTWEDLARCESGGNWAINTGNGYYGGVQFSLSSWRAVGGAAYPHQNTKWEQIHRAELLWERQGWGAWPACSRKLGLR